MQAAPAAAAAGRASAPALAPVKLDDKYTSTSGKIFISGIQALVRLPLMQRQRDLAAGLDTAGFISGYRGSPLGGLDENLWKAAKAARGKPHPFRARGERGPRRHRGVGHADG